MEEEVIRGKSGEVGKVRTEMDNFSINSGNCNNSWIPSKNKQ